MSSPTVAAHARSVGRGAPVWRRVVSQGAFEARMILRNGEQLPTDGARRIDVVAPGVLALAVMSTAFTSQAIATAFDRRNGVLRLLATTPLGRGGLLAGKILAVALVEAFQVVVIGGTAALLGWRPDPTGIPIAILVLVLGTAAFTSLALLMAGTLRAEAVLAAANLVLVVLAVGGGVVVPTTQLPGALEHVAVLLPSGALGEALRASLQHATISSAPIAVLLAWTAVLGAAAARLFRWH